MMGITVEAPASLVVPCAGPAWMAGLASALPPDVPEPPVRRVSPAIVPAAWYFAQAPARSRSARTGNARENMQKNALENASDAAERARGIFTVKLVQTASCCARIRSEMAGFCEKFSSLVASVIPTGPITPGGKNTIESANYFSH